MSRSLHPSLISVAGASALADPVRAAAAAEAEQPPLQAIGAEPLNLLKRYKSNTEGRDFVVGDLHGCYDLFMQLLEHIGFDKTKDRMFSVGDLGDRGPDSLKCLTLIREPWFKAVAGNHEQMLLDSVCKPNFDWQYWIAHGGAWATTITREELLDIAAEVAELPLAIVVGNQLENGEFQRLFNVIHAEFNGPDEALDDALENITTKHPVPLSVMWGREVIEGRADVSFQEGLSTTFVGHTPVEEVGRIGSHVFIDTGAFLAQRPNASAAHGLTAVEPATGRVFTVRPGIAVDPVKS
jgi:serine/threonine protein phosphatase 1